MRFCIFHLCFSFYASSTPFFIATNFSLRAGAAYIQLKGALFVTKWDTWPSVCLSRTHN